MKLTNAEIYVCAFVIILATVVSEVVNSGPLFACGAMACAFVGGWLTGRVLREAWQ